jgi:hypothetical protein
VLDYLNFYVCRWLGFRIIRVKDAKLVPIGIGLIFVTRDSGWGDKPFTHWRSPIFLIYGSKPPIELPPESASDQRAAE